MSQYCAKQLKISEVVDAGFTFEIPNYQRGYRWGKTEVTDLLDDINDVIKSDKSSAEVKAFCDAHPYCLQPIAFDTAKESQKSMIVVDGQQRLTTIFLILKFIEEKMKAVPTNFLPMLGIKDVSEYCRYFELKYEDPDRDDVFNKTKVDLNQIDTENIDSYHITQAYKIIKEWSAVNIGDNVMTLIAFAIKVFYGTSVIWYEIDQKTDGDSHDYFAKTNTGRIQLTNSELIKANLMLDEYCVRKVDENKFQGASEEEKNRNIAIQKDLSKLRLQNERIKMSRQWDEIENNLRNDEFWYFLAEESDEYEDTRIDFIFDIVAKKLYPDIALANMGYDEFMSFNKERGSFTIIARYLKAHENFKEDEMPIGLKVWGMAWNTYMIFKEWFENRDWYHFIGFLISVKNGEDAKQLLELFSDKRYLSKEDVKNEIIKKIKSRVKIPDNLATEEQNKEKFKEYLKTLDYNKHSGAMTDVLLLFNVISVLSDSKHGKMSSRDTYFPFSRYKKEKWNLEHVHSKADGSSFTAEFAEEFRKYLKEILDQLDSESNENIEKNVLQKALRIFNEEEKNQTVLGREKNEAIKFAARGSAQLIADKFDADLDTQKLHGIGNMALLDEKTNKSYHNAPFFMKRMIIGDIVRGKKDGVSRFIPFCTRNVFDKTYTRHPNNMLHWKNADCDEYMDVIVDTIFSYFSKQKVGNV